LLGHPLEWLSIRLLYPEHLPPERDDLLLDLRLGLPLCLQSLQGLTKHRLGLCQMGPRCVRDQRLGPLLQGEPTNWSDSRQFPLRQGPSIEDLLEEVHVQLHPEEGLTDSDEASDVQHPSQVEVLQL